MYESKHESPLDRKQFARRMLSHLLVVLGLLAGSLAFGMLGYVVFGKLSWLDAFLNSAMLLGGMGPVDGPQNAAGKLFAGIYALYAGLVIIVNIGVLSAPVVHRLLHRLHWDDEV